MHKGHYICQQVPADRPDESQSEGRGSSIAFPLPNSTYSTSISASTQLHPLLHLLPIGRYSTSRSLMLRSCVPCSISLGQFKLVIPSATNQHLVSGCVGTPKTSCALVDRSIATRRDDAPRPVLRADITTIFYAIYIAKISAIKEKNHSDTFVKRDRATNSFLRDVEKGGRYILFSSLKSGQAHYYEGFTSLMVEQPPFRPARGRMCK